MATTVYNIGLDELRDFTTDTIRAMLLDNTYTPDKDHDFVADVVAAELAGAGYARETLTTKARTVSDANDRIEYTADDPDFGAVAVGETAQYMVVYKFVTNDADSILLSCFDLGGVPTNGASFVVQWDVTDGFTYTDQGA